MHGGHMMSGHMADSSSSSMAAMSGGHGGHAGHTPTSPATGGGHLHSTGTPYVSSLGCNGPGQVMLPGFQAAYKEGNSCALFLFRGWDVDTAGKYFGAVFGAFLIGVFLNLLIFAKNYYTSYYLRPTVDSQCHCRDVDLGVVASTDGSEGPTVDVAKKGTDTEPVSSCGSSEEGSAKLPSLVLHLLVPVLYGVQMVFAYWAMLLVMLYEAWIFTALILGLTVGYAVFLVVLPRQLKPMHGTLGIGPTSTPCCST